MSSITCTSEAGTSSQQDTLQDQTILAIDKCVEINAIKIDRLLVQPITQDKQDSELQSLNLCVYDQSTLEQSLLEQAGRAISVQEHLLARKNIEKDLRNILLEIEFYEKKLHKNKDLQTSLPTTDLNNLKRCLILQKDSEVIQNQLASLHNKQQGLLKKLENLDKPENAACESLDDYNSNVTLSNENQWETEKELKIRLGEMTPFGTSLSGECSKPKETSELSAFDKYLHSKESLQGKYKFNLKIKEQLSGSSDNTENVKKVGKNKSPLKKTILIPKRRRKKEKLGTNTSSDPWDKIKSPGCSLSEKTPLEDNEDSEYLPTENESSSNDDCKVKRKVKGAKKKRKCKKYTEPEDWGTDDSDWEYSDDESRAKSRKNRKKVIDDGNIDDYLERIKFWEKDRDPAEINCKDHDIEGGLKIPKYLWQKLYNYQKVGVHWMWELNQQRCGGILGDEMGLGKTVQVIAFLGSLSHSKLLSRHGSFKGLGPTLIVCPTTVMHQWVREFHNWWPAFRVAILHESGSFCGNRHSLIKQIHLAQGILITSYVGVVQHKDALVDKDWHYIVLDEGHKIRNPDAQVTLAVKMFRTPHRIILSGSPLQNNLKELWSLFDFVFPGKLGTLPVFLAQLAVPITQGGYSNASEVQVATAYRCATVLRDTISPFLLRRMKADVQDHVKLPPKTEQVLFCKLTEEQRQYYKAYLDSGEIERILQGNAKVFVGLINLRKICNHPDLYSGGPKLLHGDNEEDVPEQERYGHWTKSGKMIVVESLLKIWKKQGHRVLLFTQSRQMLCVLEAFIQKQGYTYLKLDGGTSISARQPLINKYNQDKSFFIFLLTTRVGGLGVNLTGADRVVIYDPDWNPATDTQARERAWRIGQMNSVTVYRLVTAGTIEEKMYHRQIFKQFLSNKVLKDPKQRRFFKSNDLFELFTLKETDQEGSTETAAIFAGTGSEIKIDRNQKLPKVKFTADKVERMKRLAQKISQRVGNSSELHKYSTEAICTINDMKNNMNSLCNTEAIHDERNGNQTKDFAGQSYCEKKLPTSAEQLKRKSLGKHKQKRMFEGYEVPHLLKLKKRKMKPIRESRNIGDPELQSQQDDYVLQRLFKKSGLQTALRHDTIMEGGDADYALVEGEAQRVAKDAVKALKESRKHCYHAGQGVPNWTGQNGGTTLSKPKFGRTKVSKDQNTPGTSKESAMSSTDLLARIQSRNRITAPPGESDESNVVESNVELLTDIRNFIAFGASVDGRATTDEIIVRFQDRLPPGISPLFKFLLNEICEFHRTPSGKGIWKLKSEFTW